MSASALALAEKEKPREVMTRRAERAVSPRLGALPAGSPRHDHGQMDVLVLAGRDVDLTARPSHMGCGGHFTSRGRAS